MFIIFLQIFKICKKISRKHHENTKKLFASFFLSGRFATTDKEKTFRDKFYILMNLLILFFFYNYEYMR